MVGPVAPTGEYNLCPYLTSTAAGVDDDDNPIETALWVTCIGDQCKLWDVTYSDCRFNSITHYIKAVSDIQEHVHESHRHTKPHLTANNDPGAGAPLAKEKATATALIVEDSGGEDMDGNGYIYGKDFMIDPSDSNCPKMIATIKVIDFDGDYITWADYLDSTSIYSIQVSD